jgi:hypothetical protein
MPHRHRHQQNPSTGTITRMMGFIGMKPILRIRAGFRLNRTGTDQQGVRAC